MKRQIIKFHYVLKDRFGKVIESTRSQGPVSLLTGSGQVVRGLEKELLKLNPAEKKTITVFAHEAYGYRDEDLVNPIPLTKLPIKVHVGATLEVETQGSGKQIVTVIDKTISHVTLDGNHPLSGQDLIFEIELFENREATHEEIKKEKE